MKQALFTLLTAGVLACVGCEQEPDKQPLSAEKTLRSNNQPVSADNTLKNKRDQSTEALTPGDQGESESDRSITTQVRRDVVADDKLGITAKNVKIITREGVVTLRGPVSNAEERALVEGYAKRAAGVQSVDNQIEIASQ